MRPDLNTNNYLYIQNLNTSDNVMSETFLKSGGQHVYLRCVCGINQSKRANDKVAVKHGGRLWWWYDDNNQDFLSQSDLVPGTELLHLISALILTEQNSAFCVSYYWQSWIKFL